MSTTPTPAEAHAIGRDGTKLPPDVLEAERLAFEASVAGHGWPLEAQWDHNLLDYTASGENYMATTMGGHLTRRMWAAWRDRAALAHHAAGGEAGR